MKPRSASDSATTRRRFLQSGSAAVMAGALSPYARAGGFHQGGDEVLKVGLVGCGGRGTGAAANALRADPQVKLVALGDVFEDHLQNCLNTLQNTEDLAAKVAVDEDHRFVGFEAYKHVIEASDVVLLASSPHFRPLHMKAAVDAGRHLFVEKPVAVDAPGLRSVMDAARLARQKKLSVVSGLCYRYSFAKQATFQRLHEGDIGDIVGLQCSYNTGGLWHRGRKPEWTDMEWQMRNWLYFTWLSGDHIAEQHIHSLDKMLWAMQDENPLKCTASGGRISRTDPKYGNVYDHFNTTYEFRNGIRGFSSCRQIIGASSDVSDHVFGTKGVARLQAHRIEGPKKWRWRSEEPDDMYQNEHNELFKAIRNNEPMDNSEYMCKSTLMAIMGRMSAYTGQTITWEQALNSQENLTPPAYEWGPLEVAPVAVPGITPFS